MLNYNNMFSDITYGGSDGSSYNSSLGNSCPDGTHPAGDYSEECIPDGGGNTGGENQSCPQGQVWGDVSGGGKGCVWEDNCPSGQTINNQGQCIPITSNPVPTNNTGGTSGSGGGGFKLPPLPGNPYEDKENELWDYYTKMFGGGGDVKDPYDEAAIARLEGRLKGGAEANKAANKQAYLASRSAMGLGATGRTGQGIRNINNQADQKTSEGMIQINDTAIRANYDNQVANINRKLQVLNSQAQFAMALAGNAIERQRIQYNYAAQQMSLQNQLEMLRLQLFAQLGGS